MSSEDFIEDSLGSVFPFVNIICLFFEVSGNSWYVKVNITYLLGNEQSKNLVFLFRLMCIPMLLLNLRKEPSMCGVTIQQLQKGLAGSIFWKRLLIQRLFKTRED